MPDTKTREKDPYLVPAIAQAARVLLCLTEADSSYVSLTKVCEKVGIHRSRAFSVLHTLQKFGFVQRNTDGKGYSLGPGLLGLSRRYLDNLSAPKLAESLLEDLARKSGSTAALGLIAERNVFIAAKHEGGNPLGFTTRVGHRFPLTYGCHGKAIAAFLPKEELNELLKEKKLYFHGEPERFDKDKLRYEIKRCRERGYAEDLEEIVPGLSFVAAPVLGTTERPVGYVVVMGLPSQEAAKRAGPMVAQTGKALSHLLGSKMSVPFGK
jgi:DNA-binding IclR family transcriptional regulator